MVNVPASDVDHTPRCASLHAVDRAQRVAETFIADEEKFSRGVQQMEQAVDSASAAYATVEPVLRDLAECGETLAGPLGERTGVKDEQLVIALGRLQDLGMITVAGADDDQLVTLTPEGSQAARKIAA